MNTAIEATVKNYDGWISSERRRRQSGSALLIVFVFSAVLAIMLYRELPVVLFEAKRQKEELLVERGHEYVRAIQLFYRRNRGQFPASIEQLENTNNIRYLRRRYVDPFTGKPDWRLLHAGPGGMLIDSKVNPSPLGAAGMNAPAAGGFGAQNGTQSSSGSSNGIGSTANSNGSFGSSSDTASTPDVVVPELPQRAPAVAAGGGAAPGTPSSAELAQNPDTPLLPPSDGGASATGLPNGSPVSSGATAANPGGQQNPMPLMDPLLNSPTGANAQAQGNNAGQGNVPGQGGPSSSAANFTSAARSAFGGSSLGAIGGGSIAGVASKAGGHSIKLVDDQQEYLKWEFHYDPTKDRGLSAFGQNGAVPTPGVPVNGSPGFGPNGGNQNSGNQNSAFGNQNSGFGNQQTGFGQNQQPSSSANQSPGGQGFSNQNPAGSPGQTQSDPSQQQQTQPQ